MGSIVKVISTRLKSAARLIKSLRFGRSDVRETAEILPYGLDSNPVKDTKGYFAETTTSGQSVVIGYVNTNQQADVGEFRTFATDADGVEVFYTWMKADGTMEIGGDTDNMVRYSELESAYNELRDDLNSLVSDYNSHTHVVPQAPSGSTTSETPIPTGSPSAGNITGAKIDEIKTL
jgi:hypothetical protein